MRIFNFLNESAIGARFALSVGVAVMPLASLAEPVSAIAMYGEPALKEEGAHLPYANPDAPKGGTIRIGEPGGFDSLNPWVLKGNPVWSVGVHVPETMMMRSIDEPFTLYCLLCETVETDDERSWVAFTLRPDAKFSDGSPVTVEDVIWSYETLGTQGHPRYLGAWSKVDKIEKTSDRSFKITFKVKDRELPLLMAMRPVLKKAQWDGKTFDEASFEVPIGSSPYVIDKVDPGRSITYKRNPDYWGKDLPLVQGLNNFDTIVYDYYGDNSAMFEAFKAGNLDVWRELSGQKWKTEYNFRRVASGDVVLSSIPHKRPSGIMGLVMNTRKPQFADWRVRQALIEAFNFDFINKTLNDGDEPRITSYFSNSDLAFKGAAEGAEAELLAPFKDSLLPDTLEGYQLPSGSDQAIDRKSIRRALKLLDEAGWTIQNGVLSDKDGKPFELEILLNQAGTSMRGASEVRQLVNIYSEALQNIGIRPKVTLLDAAQYVERTNNYQFDMTWYERGLSASPGNEQMLYWGHEGVEKPGTRNWMGMNSPAAEAMIQTMVNAKDVEEFTTAVRALDRVLTAGRYVIPVSYPKETHLAHNANLKYPDYIPLYGDWPGFMPETWWSEK